MNPPPIKSSHALGQAWKELTGLPFVFAVWMTRPNTDLKNLPQRLETERIQNASRIRDIVEHHAPYVNIKGSTRNNTNAQPATQSQQPGPQQKGWPLDLAEQYLGHLLKYEINTPQLQAMQRFWDLAYELNITTRNRSLELYTTPAAAPSSP